MSLESRLKAEIAAHGPISAAQYMLRCLHDPQDGYYATRPSLGVDGDFITAPLVSQMFGELIGLWVAETWARLGAPERFTLVEMGPGDGTLMYDAVRALSRVAPEALSASDLWLVETSAPLRMIQRQTLGERPHWAPDLAGVPAGAPIILIANELLDCLPARQFVRTPEGWAERWVGLDAAGELAFGLQPLPPAMDFGQAPVGSVLERSEAQAAMGSAVGERVVADGGAALFLDYGRDAPGYGDTLQGLIRHEKVSALDRPGEADLTVHADFPAFAQAARAARAATTSIVEQGDFLRALGIEARAAALIAARPDAADKVRRQLARLVDADQMGSLFKAVAVHSPGLAPPGFES